MSRRCEVFRNGAPLERVGGLAVYDRALSGAELLAMAQHTGMRPIRTWK